MLWLLREPSIPLSLLAMLAPALPWRGAAFSKARMMDSIESEIESV